jgi:hypothetical protein
MARRILAMPPTERTGSTLEAALEDPETLMAIVEDLRERVRRDAASARLDAEFVWRFLREPGREVGIFDETEYFRGEAALLASIACRHLGDAGQARRWHERADADFRLTVNAVADCTRVGFERLAWALEEGRFSDVATTAPLVAESFRRCGMVAEAVRSHLIDAQARLVAGDAEGLLARVEALSSEALSLGDSETVLEADRMLARIRGIPDRVCAADAEAPAPDVSPEA